MSAEHWAESTRAPEPPTPTITPEFTLRTSGTQVLLASSTRGSNSSVTKGGVVCPSPVTNIRRISPGFALFVTEMTLPSDRTTTARTCLSLSVNWKMPGLSGNTVTGNGDEATPFAATTSGTVAGGIAADEGVSQGTCTAADSWPFIFATHRIGAITPPNWTVRLATWVCGATNVEVTPCSVGANPVPEIVARLHGDTSWFWNPAELTIPVIVGPGGFTVRLNVRVYVVLPDFVVAVITTGPEVVALAVTVTCAWPCALVAALAVALLVAPRVAGPLVTAKSTVAPSTGVLLSFTCTISASVKAAPSKAVWLLPEMGCIAVITVFTYTVKTRNTELLPASETVTCTQLAPAVGQGPDPAVGVIHDETSPLESEVDTVLLSVARPNVCFHTTAVPLEGFPPASVT